jgi:hypothetical protein
LSRSLRNLSANPIPDPETYAIRDPRPQIPLFGSELIDVAQPRWGVACCENARAASYLRVYTQRAECP